MELERLSYERHGLLSKKIWTLISQLREDAKRYCALELAISPSVLRILRARRILVLLDGGARTEGVGVRLVRRRDTSVHLVFSDRGDISEYGDEVWVGFEGEQFTLEDALGAAMSSEGTLSGFKPFSTDSFGVSVPVSVLDNILTTAVADRLKEAAVEYVRFELRWLDLFPKRTAEPLFGVPPKTAETGNECLWLLPTEFEEKTFERLQEACVASCRSHIGSFSRVRWTSQPDLLHGLWTHIHEARFVVADISSDDPMIFYAIGLAHGANIPVILMSRSDTIVPFDLDRVIPIKYDNLEEDLAELPAALNQAFELVTRHSSKLQLLPRPSLWPTLLRDPRLVFVLMPFRRPWSDQVWRTIIQTTFTGGRYPFECRRADDWRYPEQVPEIMRDIWRGICTAEVIVADLTDRNPNVLYELGLAHSIRKDFLIVSQDMRHVPEGLRRFRVVLYDPSAGLTPRLREELLVAAERMRIGGAIGEN